LAGDSSRLLVHTAEKKWNSLYMQTQSLKEKKGCILCLITFYAWKYFY